MFVCNVILYGLPPNMHPLSKWFHTPTLFLLWSFSLRHSPAIKQYGGTLNVSFISLFHIIYHSCPFLFSIAAHYFCSDLSVMLFSNKRRSNFCLLLMAAHTAIRRAPAVQRQGRASCGPPCHPALETQADAAAPTTAWGACMHALEVMLMGDFNYISLLPPFRASSPTGAADMSLEQTQGTLIKGLVLVLNSLLLERPAFISLAQQTTDTHRRLRVRTRLHSYTQIACGVCACVFVCFGPELQRLLRKMGVAVTASFFGNCDCMKRPQTKNIWL